MYSRGWVFVKLGKYEEALDCYEKALKIDPKHVNAWCNKGNVFKELERYSEALKCYDKALELDPDFKEAQVAKKELESVIK